MAAAGADPEVERALAQVRQLDAAADSVEELVATLERVPMEELERQLPPLEAANLHVSLAYAVDMLFYSYVRAGGGSAPPGSPLAAELDRLKKYVLKVQAARREAAEEGQA